MLFTSDLLFRPEKIDLSQNTSANALFKNTKEMRDVVPFLNESVPCAVEFSQDKNNVN